MRPVTPTQFLEALQASFCVQNCPSLHGVPTAAAAHVPVLHDPSHCPEQAVLQHTPPTQWPLTQFALEMHAEPLAPPHVPEGFRGDIPRQVPLQHCRFILQVLPGAPHFGAAWAARTPTTSITALIKQTTNSDLVQRDVSIAAPSPVAGLTPLLSHRQHPSNAMARKTAGADHAGAT